VVLIECQRVFEEDSADHHIVVTVLANSAVEGNLIKLASLTRGLTLF